MSDVSQYCGYKITEKWGKTLIIMLQKLVALFHFWQRMEIEGYCSIFPIGNYLLIMVSDVRNEISPKYRLLENCDIFRKIVIKLQSFAYSFLTHRCRDTKA